MKSTDQVDEWDLLSLMCPSVEKLFILDFVMVPIEFLVTFAALIHVEHPTSRRLRYVYVRNIIPIFNSEGKVVDGADVRVDLFARTCTKLDGNFSEEQRAPGDLWSKPDSSVVAELLPWHLGLITSTVSTVKDYMEEAKVDESLIAPMFTKKGTILTERGCFPEQGLGHNEEIGHMQRKSLIRRNFNESFMHDIDDMVHQDMLHHENEEHEEG